jgi:hypothetical protein
LTKSCTRQTPNIQFNRSCYKPSFFCRIDNVQSASRYVIIVRHWIRFLLLLWWCPFNIKKAKRFYSLSVQLERTYFDRSQIVLNSTFKWKIGPKVIFGQHLNPVASIQWLKNILASICIVQCFTGIMDTSRIFINYITIELYNCVHNITLSYMVLARDYPKLGLYCSLSLWRVARGSKLMRLELIHGLFIT